jgi:hypothetical protein
VRALVLSVLAALAVLAGAAAPRPAAASAAGSAALLARYEPVVLMYRSDWRPRAVAPFLAAADLERRSGIGWELVRRSPPAAALADGGSDLRLDTRGCSPAVDEDSCYRRRAGRAFVYGRVWKRSTATTGIATVLQYWLFYPLDDWRNSITAPTLWHMHEGDWEEVSVALDAAGRPVRIACSQHDLGVTQRWTRVATRGDTHPVVYAALGSHANYLAPGRHSISPQFSGVPLPEPDFASSQTSYGPAGHAAHTLTVLDLTAGTAPWLSFAGDWGDGGFVLVGRKERRGIVYAHLRVGGSPSGPAFHAIWRDPLLAFRSWPLDGGH